MITVALAARRIRCPVADLRCAIPEFGVIDLVGHAVIIIVLIVLILSNNPIWIGWNRPQRSRQGSVCAFTLCLVAEATFFT